MKYLIFLFFLSTSFTTYSQSEESLHIGINIASYFTEVIGDDQLITNQKSAHAIACELSYNLSPNYQLSTGVRYRKIGFNNIDHSLSFDCDFINDPFDASNSWLGNNIESDYLAFPIGLIVNLNPSVNHFYLNYEIEFLLNLRTNSTVNLHECGLNTIAFGSTIPQAKNNIILASLGLGYQIGVFKGKGNLAIEPTISLSLNKSNLNNTLTNISNDFRGFLFGLRLGIST